MDEKYLLAAVRYVELNPVRAGLVSDPGEYQWSSARAHRRKRDDPLVKVKPMLERYPDWQEFLAAGVGGTETMLIRRHAKTGRPLGEQGFVEQVERNLGRLRAPKKRGPRPRQHS